MIWGYYIEIKNSKGKWHKIAKFQNQQDRNDCLDFLANKYKDCKFQKYDE